MMKRNKAFWSDIRQINDFIFERLGITDYTVIETAASNLKHFLGDARLTVANYGDGYWVNFYEAADADFCAVAADGECMIHIVQYSQPPTVKPAKRKRLLTAQDLFGDTDI